MVTPVIEDRFESLMGRAITELRNRTDITQLTPGAKARALLEIVMRETGNAYQTFDTQLLKAFIRYSTGRELDMLGEMLGIARLTATRAEVDSLLQVQKFYVDGGATFGTIDSSAEGYFTIPRGTRVQTVTTGDEEPIVYVLSEDVVCNHTDTEVYAAIESLEFGSDANIGAGTLVEHNFEQYTDYLNNSLLTTNVDSIIYATDTETDENFRYRMVNQTIGAETANPIAVKLAALIVPGVADATIDEYSHGIGSGAIYVKAVTPTPTDALIAAVQSSIKRVGALGNYIEARAPTPIGVEFTVTLKLHRELRDSESEELKGRVRDRLVEYINGLDIDQEIYLADLVTEIMAVDNVIKRVGEYRQPFDEFYIWKYSAAEDNRVRRKLVADRYVPDNFERVVTEYTIQTPIRIRAKLAE